MPRKTVQGPIRDREKTKQKLLSAVGKIIKTKGYSGLLVSKIADVAGFDKKLIYEYFGSAENLIEEYIKSQDYWSNIDVDPNDNFDDKGEKFVKNVLKNQFDGIHKNKELQRIIVWELSESKPILKKLLEEREEKGERFFAHITDPHFENEARTYRAIVALLVGGIHHLNLYTLHNGTTFCGIDLKSAEGRKDIAKAIDTLVELTYKSKELVE
ncbi:TetR/AcrR family transcriptional regulator [Chryseobacterium sp.]|uniref:TetR/AcrR family transcriptional regulator n=1 Tax=Chryseobacterium sp. TaxID=1871047 RepID=UPI003890821A